MDALATLRPKVMQAQEAEEAEQQEPSEAPKVDQPYGTTPGDDDGDDDVIPAAEASEETERSADDGSQSQAEQEVRLDEPPGLEQRRRDETDTKYSHCQQQTSEPAQEATSPKSEAQKDLADVVASQREEGVSAGAASNEQTASPSLADEKAIETETAGDEPATQDVTDKPETESVEEEEEAPAVAPSSDSQSTQAAATEASSSSAATTSKLQRASSSSHSRRHSYNPSQNDRSSRRISSSQRVSTGYHDSITGSSSTAGGKFRSSRPISSSAASLLSLHPPPLKIRDFGFPETDPRHVGARDVGLNTSTSAYFPHRASQDWGDDDDQRAGGSSSRWTTTGGSSSRSNNLSSVTQGEDDWGPDICYDEDDEEFEGDHGAGMRRNRASQQQGGGTTATMTSSALNPASSQARGGGGGGGSNTYSQVDSATSLSSAADSNVSRSNSSMESGLQEGLYRVLYDFEAESEHELTVVVDDLVRVVGVVEGGWAVGFKEGSASSAGGGEVNSMDQGLVPEGYLEWYSD